MAYKVGIIGGSGYTGSELLRILALHRDVEVTAVSSRKHEGVEVEKVHPYLRSFYDLRFVSPDLRNFEDCDVVFTAVPHGEAMKYVPDLIETGLKVVDLSADYRLKKDVYEKVYGEHTGYIEAVYGLPEIHGDEVKKAKLVANPGCYPTGCILAAYPLSAENLVEKVVFDSKSGITGAGAKPSEFTHYPNLHEAIVPYKVTEHRHLYEMIQELGCNVSFTPQVYPGSRGILTVAHVFLKESMTLDELRELYEKFYSNKPFVRLQDSVRLSWVRGSNFCDIAVYMDERSSRAVIVSAIDNLVKGASGQAIQNMNLMLGLDETEGLLIPPLFP